MSFSSGQLTFLVLFSFLSLGMGTYNFLDTDQIIEKAVDMTIPEIFKEEGEAEFRRIEGQVLDSVHAYVRCVVSTGGGIVCRMENWSKLQTGIVVWLDVEPDVILKRMEQSSGRDNRPLLQNENPLETLQNLLKERKDRYSQADVRIKVTEDMCVKTVADTVIRELHDFIDNNPPQWKLAKAKAKGESILESYGYFFVFQSHSEFLFTIYNLTSLLSCNLTFYGMYTKKPRAWIG